MQAKPEEAAAASGPGSSASSSATNALARFDFSWFIPALVKYRKLLGEVLLISFMLQLFGLVSPLFFQVVMDKVLVHKDMTTLDVLVIGLVIVVIFESVLSALRAYVFSHTTSRIDVELGARLFRHLVALPLAYFQARRVGDSVARVRELENIRSFLTGNTLTVLLSLPLYFASAWRWCRSCARAGWLTLTGEHPRINTVACTPTLRHSHPTRLRGWFVG